MILALGLAFGLGTYFMSAMESKALTEQPKISEDKRLSSVNNQFTRILSGFDVIESLLNTQEKQNFCTPYTDQTKDVVESFAQLTRLSHSQLKILHFLFHAQRLIFLVSCQQY